MRKVVPRPTWLATSILPPWFLMIRSQIARPNPNPLFFLEVKKGWKSFGMSLSFDSKTGIRYAYGYFLSLVLRLYRQSSSIRHCIARIEIEIHQDLLNLPGVGINPW
jgi:hypothetical protein